jgi:endonuclease/exonuclease/phosphatase family metal-dependent hydrolase
LFGTLFTFTTQNTRFPYSQSYLCDQSLKGHVSNRFINVDGHNIFKGYCPQRFGWAPLQQKQIPGFGPYGGVLSTMSMYHFTNETFLMPLKELLMEDIRQNYDSLYCLDRDYIIINFKQVKTKKLYHTSDYHNETKVYLWNAIDPMYVSIYMGTNFHLIVSVDYKHSHWTQIMTLTSTPSLGVYITSNIVPVKNVDRTISQIRIMSYNIQHFFKGWSLRLDMIRDLITRSVPDIIGFQEIRLDENQEQNPTKGSYSTTRHMLQQLREALSGLAYKYYTYQPAMSYIGMNDIYMSGYQITRHEEGVAIFSKFAILSHEYILLSRNVSDHNSHQRICLHAKIQISKNKILDFYNTHLSLSDHPRQINMGEILSLTNDDNLQVIVGDYNSEPHEWTIQMLNERNWIDTHKLYCESKNKTNSACNGGHPVNTFSTDLHFKKRIDFIYVKNNTAISVIDFNVIGGDQYLSHYPSDHYGICTTLQFEY